MKTTPKIIAGNITHDLMMNIANSTKSGSFDLNSTNNTTLVPSNERPIISIMVYSALGLSAPINIGAMLPWPRSTSNRTVGGVGLCRSKKETTVRRSDAIHKGIIGIFD